MKARLWISGPKIRGAGVPAEVFGVRLRRPLGLEQATITSPSAEGVRQQIVDRGEDPVCRRARTSRAAGRRRRFPPACPRASSVTRSAPAPTRRSPSPSNAGAGHVAGARSAAPVCRIDRTRSRRASAGRTVCRRGRFPCRRASIPPPAKSDGAIRRDAFAGAVSGTTPRPAPGPREQRGRGVVAFAGPRPAPCSCRPSFPGRLGDGGGARSRRMSRPVVHRDLVRARIVAGGEGAGPRDGRRRVRRRGRTAMAPCSGRSARPPQRFADRPAVSPAVGRRRRSAESRPLLHRPSARKTPPTPGEARRTVRREQQAWRYRAGAMAVGSAGQLFAAVAEEPPAAGDFRRPAGRRRAVRIPRPPAAVRLGVNGRARRAGRRHAGAGSGRASADIRSGPVAAAVPAAGGPDGDAAVAVRLEDFASHRGDRSRTASSRRPT